MIAVTFDPYHKWLGISPKEQPPNHYRLLALELFEADPDVVEAGADQRMAHVRTFQSGQNSALSQRILNELSAAKLCLLNPAKKAEYDHKLRQELAAKQPQVVPPKPMRTHALDQGVSSHPLVSPQPAVSIVDSPRATRTSARPRPVWQIPAGIGVTAAIVALAVYVVVNSGGPEKAAELTADADARPAKPPQASTVTNPPRAKHDRKVNEDRPLETPSSLAANDATTSVPPSPSLPDKTETKARPQEIETDASQSPLQFDVVIADGVTLRLVKIPASADGTIKLFYLGQTEVTQEQWQAVMHTNPGHEPLRDQPKIPINNVTFAECQAFCRAVEEMPQSVRFDVRLPTAAELLHACYLGTTPSQAYGDDLMEYAWCRENSQNTLRPVATRKPNAWGLYDILGNAWEWTDEEAQLVGGCWWEELTYLMSGRPITQDAKVTKKLHSFGFRVAADLKSTAAAPSDTAAMSATSDKAEPHAASPTPTAAAKRPALPAGDDLARARRLVLETYGKELSADDKAAGVRSLLKSAADAHDDLVGQAALLLVAVDVATEACDLRLAFEAHDELGLRFDYDPLAAKTKTVEDAAKTARADDDRVQIVNRALVVIDEAIQGKRFDLAERAGKSAQAASAKIKNTEVRKEISTKRKEVDRRQKQHDALQKALAEAGKTLEKAPENAAANELLGKHHCFDRNDWPRGLAHLAKGADEKLRRIAMQDLDGANEPEGQIVVGDGWWELAETTKNERDRVGFRSRAVFWYAKALPELNGLAKGKVVKRLKHAADALAAAASQVGNDGGKHVNVLLSPDISMRLVKIPPSSDGKIQSFYLGQTEVTQQQWQLVMGDNPSDAGTIGEQLPVNMITLADCRKFCDAIQRTPLGARYAFRLPTEAELLYVCYAGMPATAAYPDGVLEHAWCRENAGEKLHPVAGKKPNAWGLFDNLGNVWERPLDDEFQLVGGSVFDLSTLLLNGHPTSSGVKVDRAPNFGVRIAADLK